MIMHKMILEQDYINTKKLNRVHTIQHLYDSISDSINWYDESFNFNCILKYNFEISEKSKNLNSMEIYKIASENVFDKIKDEYNLSGDFDDYRQSELVEHISDFYSLVQDELYVVMDNIILNNLLPKFKTKRELDVCIAISVHPACNNAVLKMFTGSFDGNYILTIDFLNKLDTVRIFKKKNMKYSKVIPGVNISILSYMKPQTIAINMKNNEYQSMYSMELAKIHAKNNGITDPGIIILNALQVNMAFTTLNFKDLYA